MQDWQLPYFDSKSPATTPFCTLSSLPNSEPWLDRHDQKLDPRPPRREGMEGRKWGDKIDGELILIQ
jgi:hypothetical protein